MNVQRTKNVIQICWCLDCNGVMKPYFEKMQNTFINTVLRYFHKKITFEKSKWNIEFSIVLLFNYPPFSSRLVTVFPFTKKSPMELLKFFANDVKFGGGGMKSGVLQEGLAYAFSEVDWKKSNQKETVQKYCYFLGAIPDKNQNNKCKTFGSCYGMNTQRIYELFKNRGINLYFVFPEKHLENFEANFKWFHSDEIQRKNDLIIHSTGYKFSQIENALGEMERNTLKTITKKVYLNTEIDGTVQTTNLGSFNIQAHNFEKLKFLDWPQHFIFPQNNPMFNLQFCKQMYDEHKLKIAVAKTEDPMLKRYISSMSQTQRCIVIQLPRNPKWALYFFPRNLFLNSVKKTEEQDLICMLIPYQQYLNSSLYAVKPKEFTV